VCSLQEELQKLRSQAQHWEMLHRDREQTLAIMKEELTVCKAELAFLEQDRQQLLSGHEQCEQAIRSLQEELQQLRSQAQLWEQWHWDTLQSQAAHEEELAFLKKDRQQLQSDLEQSRQEIHSLQEELKKLSSGDEHWEKLQFDSLQSQAAHEEELAFLKQDRQQLLSAQEQCRQEIRSQQEELQQLRSQAQRWEMLHWVSEKTLDIVKEELAVCKFELVFFEGELRKISEQQQDANRMRTNHSPRAEGAQPEPQALLEDGSVQG
ncbi:hypothetical protein ASZ78_009733, partial [Callipepla squamata]